MKPFLKAVSRAAEEGRRLIVPLAGFPGLNLTGCTVKLAQQNYGEHFKVLKAIAETFKPDAVFPLMDLSVEANALGRFTVFPKEESATVPKDSFSAGDLEKAEEINISFDARLLGYVETVKLMKLSLPGSILRGAYVTGPYTLAALLMGADEAAIATVLYPEKLANICRFTTEKIHEYIRLLISAGAQIICILEPSAVMLGPEQFEEFSSFYVKNICQSYKYTGTAVVYHVCGNSMHLIEKMAESGADALSLDSPETGVELAEAARRVPPDIILIGNINPIGPILRGSPEDVEREVSDLCRSMIGYPNFVLSTGCDLPQEVPVENLKTFMSAGRSFKFR